MKKIQFDGCAVPNPGYMGIGVVLIENAKIITTISKKLPDKGTNNIAEYNALLKGIEKALELGWKEVSIEGDSRLVINQINGTWKVKKEHLEKLYNDIINAVSKFDSYSANWIPRENNSIADKLACKALGYEEDPHRVFKIRGDAYDKKNADIKCPECKRDCEFKWQEFKNGTSHINQECLIHGHIRYTPKKEPYLSLVKQRKKFVQTRLDDSPKDGIIKISKYDEGRIMISYPYNENYNAMIKTIRGRKFHADNKCWSLPFSNDIIKRLETIFEGNILNIDPSVKQLIENTYDIEISKSAEGLITVTFKIFNYDYVEKIKSIQGRQFHVEGEKKYWSLPFSNGIIKRLESMFEGTRIYIDSSITGKYDEAVPH